MTTKAPGRLGLFGTDGIRGAFGEPPLDETTVTALGRALAACLRAEGLPDRVLLGGDTRASTESLCRWLAAGLRGGGCEAGFAGVLPTPGIAFLTRSRKVGAGIVVSASHNPWPDNGIKLFDRRGFKWDPAAEARLEELLPDTGEAAPPAEPLRADPSLRADYASHLEATLGGRRPLQGLRIVLDHANGAASGLAARVFEAQGAAVHSICDAPDGSNINLDCGSTHLDAVARATRETRSDLGFAFDGDADRVLLVDRRGREFDGDAMLFLWARRLRRQGRLDPPRIVATSMSNLGLERALGGEGIGVERCEVGDRAVVETLRREGLCLGGEQSGHLVHLDLGTTGDGILTALQVAAIIAADGRPLAQQLKEFRRYPQVLKNVRVVAKPDLLSLPRVRETVGAVESRLGSDGRLVLRYSGTEPLARVMIEGPDPDEVGALADRLVAAIAAELGEPR